MFSALALLTYARAFLGSNSMAFQLPQGLLRNYFQKLAPLIYS